MTVRPEREAPLSLPASEEQDTLAGAEEGRALRERVRQATEIRLDKVEQVCRDLAAGRYRSDSRTVADRILAAMERDSDTSDLV